MSLFKCTECWLYFQMHRMLTLEEGKSHAYPFFSSPNSSSVLAWSWYDRVVGLGIHVCIYVYIYIYVYLYIYICIHVYKYMCKHFWCRAVATLEKHPPFQGQILGSTLQKLPLTVSHPNRSKQRTRRSIHCALRSQKSPKVLFASPVVLPQPARVANVPLWHSSVLFSHC